jgi:hypothetical protein
MNKFIHLLTCIIFISAILLCGTVRADIVFQDNFGGGNLNNWTVSGSPNVVTSPVVVGSKYSVQFTSTSNDESTFSYIQASFTQSNTATLEFYFQTDTTPPYSSSIELAQIMTSTSINSEPSGLLSLSLNCVTNNSLGWTFIYPSGENTPTGSKTPVNYLKGQFIQSRIQMGVWYKIDLSVDTNGNTGTIQLSINNSPLYTLNNIHFIWNPTIFRLGPLISTGYNSGNIYFDDVTITNTTNIQQSTVTSSPTISPTESTSGSSTVLTSPTPTVPEFPALVIVPLLLFVFSVVIVRHRKTK